MATTARRIGLSIRSRRKTSREEDGVISGSRKINSGKKISREESKSFTHGARPCHGINEREIYCLDCDHNTEMTPNLSRPVTSDTSMVVRSASDKPRRKISVYARPESLERRVNNKESQTRWQDFLITYEPFILPTLALLILSVSIYIVFVERQSLFSKQKS